MIMMNMEILLNQWRVHQLALVVCLLTWEAQVSNTVGIEPILSDPFTHQNSKFGVRYFEANRINRNILQIRTNCQKGTGTKMAEKLSKFEKFERKKEDFSPVLNPDTSWWLARCPRPLKVRIFWEGHKILRNLHLTFFYSTYRQK